MKQLFFALAAVLTGQVSFSQDAGKLLSAYDPVRLALVSGNSKAAAEAATAFQLRISGEAEFAEKAGLLQAVGKMLHAGSLEKQRAALNDISVLLWKLVKGSGAVSQPVYYQYCPMKNAYWLSMDKEIRNPYYGSSMLACGKVVDTKP